MATLATRSPAGMMKDYVIRYFGDQGVSLAGWEWTLGKQPTSPDKLITFIDQGGPGSFPHLRVDYLGLQMVVRGPRGGDGYNVGYLMARQVRDAILGMPNSPPEFEELDGVTERGTIVPIGYDEADRHSWSCNFQLLVEPGANVLTHRASL